jgi:transglutaminase-like putative cysteine protease
VSVSFAIAAVPPWVKTIEPASKGQDEDPGGISYLLVDRQENVDLQSAYYHEARQVTSDKGVQNGASVTVSFDPAYQALTFHFLHVTRRGTRSNRLDRSQIKLFQREKEMESFLYDGAYTAQCELEDIRVGDIIEFAYTIKGANPVKAGRYSRVFYTDWSFRVQRVITRLVYAERRKLHFLIKNRQLKPTIVTARGTTEWLSDETAVPPRRIDADVPVDYDPNGWVQISEYESWQEVVDWAVPLFQPESSLSVDLQSEVAKLLQIPDVEERVLAALRLVGDEVRYLGIESGVGSHWPTAPSEVYRRRFGDCKDKALLLATLLRHCSIEAVPALVSTTYRGTVADRLPAPEDFDHAIVHATVGNQAHWLDPTRSGQRGPLSQIYVRDLKLALLLRPRTQALTAYTPPPGSLPRKKITELYRVPAPGGTGELEVLTESHGLSAERTRSFFHESGREKIEKQYLQYYARTFPRIAVKKALVYEEVPGANACRIREFYSIPDIWQFNEEEKKYELVLYPGDVGEAMGSAGPSQRDDPLALNYPADVTQQIHARVFEEWTLNTKNQRINNAFFRFSDEAKIRDRDIYLNYSYEALADRVSPSDLPAYNAALSKIKDTLGYSLSYRASQTPFEFRKWVRQLNWRVGVAAAGTLLIAMVLGALFIYKSERTHPLPPPAPGPNLLEGLGGWLILVGLHHVVRPIGLIATLIMLFPVVFNLDTWLLFTVPGQPQYNPSWKPIVLYEVFFNLVCLVWSGVLAVLFFRKQAVWPRCYAAFLLFFLIGMALDTYFAQRLPEAGSTGSITDLVRVTVAAAVWIPYCFVSERVKATFRY